MLLTMDDIVAGLPRSLYGAFLQGLSIDYVARRATFELRVCVGNPEAYSQTEREAYRPATLSVWGLLWCVVEPPEAVDGDTTKGLWIDAGSMSDLGRKPALPAVPEGVFVWWIFVRQWNAFIYIAGQTASIES